MTIPCACELNFVDMELQSLLLHNICIHIDAAATTFTLLNEHKCGCNSCFDDITWFMLAELVLTFYAAHWPNISDVARYFFN